MKTFTIIVYETRNLRFIRISTQVIVYVILFLYLFCAFEKFFNVEWTDLVLPSKYINRKTSSDDIEKQNIKIDVEIIIVIAAYKAELKKIVDLLNDCIIFSTLSAASSSLYMASRILYGMTRDIHSRSRFAIFKRLGSVWNKTGVSVRALTVSFLVLSGCHSFA